VSLVQHYNVATTRPGLSGAALLLLAAFANAAPPASAQEPAPAAHTPAARIPADWADAWQPLGTRSSARGGEILPLPPRPTLDAPARGLGLAWIAGNPAGLPWEAATSWTALAAEHRRISGEHRRPLDAASEQRDLARGTAWGAFDADRVGIGSAEIGRTLAEPGAFGLALAPYSGNPFVSTDAEQPDLRTIDATLEGALGIRFGGWGVGVGAGYAGAEQRTIAHTTQRYLRDTDYATTMGVLRAFAGGGMRAGLHARVGAGAAVTAISTLTEGTQVRTLIGYTEPDPIVVGVPGSFYRRGDRTRREATLSLIDERGGLDWMIYGSLGEASESMTRQRLAAPDDPHDDWTVQHTVIGAGAAHDGGALGSWMLLARVRRDTGEGNIADVNEPVYITSDDHMDVALTWLPPWRGAAWRTAVNAGIGYAHRRHTDRLSRMRSDLVTWSPTLGAEAAWSPAGSLDVTISYTRGFYQPSGSLPAAERFGDSARELIAPELAYYSMAARPQAVALALTWRVAPADIVLTGQHASIGAQEPGRRFDIHPRGDRTASSITLEFRPR
jgi:hypothetical protein